MLQGERVRLRALEPTDVDAIWTWHHDHEFHVLDGWIYPSSRKQLADLVDRVTAPRFTDVWLGIETETATLIGYTTLKRARPEHRSAEFGIAIERGHWDAGYGTDATRTILRFAFTQMGLHRVELDVLDTNARAQRVYEKVGFQVEGRARESRFRDGRWHDTVRMSILAHEFAALDGEAP
jgi:RimJ/RimL family protein N-acetyltransferase